MTAAVPLCSRRAEALKGDVSVPGDKSISHRALILSSQAPGMARISGLLEGEDVLNTARALQLLGANMERKGTGSWEVRGSSAGGLTESPHVLDLGNSGTGVRLLMGLVTPYPFTTFFTGDESLRKRPMKRAMEPLSQMGATFAARDGNFLPLALTGTASPSPANYHLPVASAQVKSAILLAALNTVGETTVIEPRPTRDHTENMLRHLGFQVDISSSRRGEVGRGAFLGNNNVSQASPHPSPPPTGEGISIAITGRQNIQSAEREIPVPGDPSSAAFLAVAALISPGSEITMRNVCINPLRAGLFVTLREMGAKIRFQNERIVAGEKVADITVAFSELKGITVPAERAPSMIDEYPILAVAAAFAQGETVMHGLAELRVKESDRLAAIVSALTACGANARAQGDSLYITGLPTPKRSSGFAQAGGEVKGGATVATHYDHRIAMSFLVLGMASREPVTVDDGSSIKTSFPNFVELMNSLGARIEMTGLLDDSMTQNNSGHPVIRSSSHPLVIAIDGPAASGKGTLARRLAEHFELDYLDTGSLYRAVGMKLVYGGKNPSDVKAAVEAARSIDAEDLANPRLRQERIGQAASVVSAFPEVRRALLEFQRNFAAGKKGAVLDGRDIGTVVCPDADFKFFLTATLYARARRRHKELQGQGIEVVFESVLEDLRERDERDEKRTVAPLKPASDAVILDTSDMDASEVFKKICQAITGKKAQ